MTCAHETFGDTLHMDARTGRDSHMVKCASLRGHSIEKQESRPVKWSRTRVSTAAALNLKVLEATQPTDLTDIERLGRGSNVVSAKKFSRQGGLCRWFSHYRTRDPRDLTNITFTGTDVGKGAMKPLRQDGIWGTPKQEAHTFLSQIF